MRPGTGVLKDSRGLTLVEVMIAMLISFIVFLGLTETIVVTLDANARNALRGEAGRVAEEQINEMKNVPFDNIVVPSALIPASSDVLRVYQHMTTTYHVTRSVIATETNMKQIFVTVAWNRVNKKDNAGYSTTFTTIVRKK